MSPTDKVIAIQAILGVAQDGKFGSKTQAALNKVVEDSKTNPQSPIVNGGSGATAVSSPGWDFVVRVDGPDLVIDNARVTCFGGSGDKMDNGDTASGVSTKPPETLGCALPRNYIGSSTAQLKALGGSPIPANLPFKTPVQFSANGKSITVPFIDVGPAKWTGNEGDLTIAAAKQFKPNATANNFEINGVEIRILGGAEYL